MMPQGSQVSFQVVRGTSGFLSSRCSRIGPHLARVESVKSVYSPVGTGISGFLSDSSRESGLV